MIPSYRSPDVRLEARSRFVGGKVPPQRAALDTGVVSATLGNLALFALACWLLKAWIALVAILVVPAAAVFLLLAAADNVHSR
jgi:hypothetical protein